MTGGIEFLGLIQHAFPGAVSRLTFPFIRVRITSPNFQTLSQEDREAAVATALGYDVGTLRSTIERLFIRLEFADADDPPQSPVTGETWLGLFTDTPRRLEIATGPSVVHFYGFKGGQGRTTLLAFLANDLASDGLRVLVLDLDAEAPSLDLVFGTSDVPPEASLVGLRAGLSLAPMPISAPRGGGSVSLVAFRPSAEEFDLDATALAFEASVHPPSQERLAIALRESVGLQYDVILADHRTGLGSTVPAWLHAIPGPIVVMDRLDGQSRRARRDVARIWHGLPNPGALVSYIAKGMSNEAARTQLRGEAWPWLDTLADAKSQRAETTLSAEDIDDHWVLWPDDNAFRRGTLPHRDEVGGETANSVKLLREVLGLAQSVAREEAPVALHPSGASDQGLFIVTEALRDLSQTGSPIRFVVGRKGTGKTRLLAELARRKVGVPLVVAEDETLGGLPAHDAELQALVKRARRADDLEGLWWTLIATALEANGTSRDKLEVGLKGRPELADGTVVRALGRGATSRVFLVDGLETMSRREEAREIIQALLTVNSGLENDPVLRGRVSLRIFLRTDIARWGFENFEQQSHGKRVELTWSTQTILNFVLSRLPHLPWITRMFPKVIESIRARESEIQQGNLSIDDSLGHLLEIFPPKLGRLNLNTTTFLRTYFSDDPSGEQSYYPRVYDKFLLSIDAAGRPLAAGRVAQDVIMTAHDQASAEFLTQVRQELRFLVPLKDPDLDRLIGALKEERTPFAVRALARAVRNSLKFKKEDIDATFEAMKEIGIFEQHPSNPALWRVGRLFKAALGMKYGTAK